MLTAEAKESFLDAGGFIHPAGSTVRSSYQELYKIYVFFSNRLGIFLVCRDKFVLQDERPDALITQGASQ
jgi:hypothetical protein